MIVPTQSCDYSRTPLIQMLVIQITNYPDQLGPKGKFVENVPTQSCDYSRTQLIRTLVIQITNYPDRLGPKGKFVGNVPTQRCDYSRTPLIRTLVIQITNYPDRLGPKGKFAENVPTQRCDYSRTPLIRMLVIQITNYPDRLGPKGKFVENSTKITCLEITGYWMKCGTVLWLIELQIRLDQKVYMQVHAVKSNSQTSSCQCDLFLPVFYAYPDGSLSQLTQIGGVLL